MDILLDLAKEMGLVEKQSKELQIQIKKKCNSCNSKIITNLTCWFSRYYNVLWSYRGVTEELQEGCNSYIGVTVTRMNNNGWRA